MMKKAPRWKNPIFWACLTAFSFCLQLALFLERIASKPNVVMHMHGQGAKAVDAASTGWMDTVGTMLASSPGQNLNLALMFTVFMYFFLKAIRHVTRASEA